ncbi:MAG TPA: PIG-L family deacetylase [Clostridiales bacterium]|nr:PIG-L family deacetylase [Clostridiales bacterium]
MKTKQLRMLVIGAHPDDCEFKAAGTAIKFRQLGHVVKFVSATNGDTGHYEIGGGQLARIRAEEVEKSCSIAGLKYQIMDIHNNGLEADIQTRERFITLIREFVPDIIITHRPNDYHPDHRRTSLLVQDSSYAIIIPNVCPLTPVMPKAPVILYMQDNFKRPYEFVPDIVVDIDDVFDIKTQMINCHKSQLYEWLPWTENQLDQIPQGEEERIKWLKEYMLVRDGKVANRFRNQIIDKYGIEHGSNVKTAEAFEICEYGAPAEEDILNAFDSGK